MSAIDNGHLAAAEFERTPPNDLAAERGVLGAMLLSRDAIADAGAYIRPRDHYRPGHQVIHEAILELDGAGEAADMITVGALLLKRGQIAKVGGGSYLHDLVSSVATAAFAGDHAKIVREHAVRRRLIEYCTRGVQLAYSGDGDADEIAARVLAEVEAAVSPMGANTLPSFAEILQGTISALESKAPRGISLPWRDLDALLLGLAPGQLVLVAARPAIGKSVVAADIAVHTAAGTDHEPGRPVLFMSAEMSRDEIATRILAAQGRVNLHTLLSRNLGEADWERVNGAYHRIGDAPLVLDDEPGPTAAHIQARLREMDRDRPAELLVVDYLQLMEAGRAESRQVAVADLGWALKQIGRKRGIPVVVACQLNRNPEMRADKRPQISDLRESGALEQHADVIILLHREDAYDPESVRAGEIDLIVGKNRQGPKGTVTAAFLGHFSRVMDMARA